MKVAVLHALFSDLGGADVLAINLGKALNDLGFNIDFYTFELNPNIRRILSEVPGNLRIFRKPAYVKVLEGLSSGRLLRLRRILLYRYLAKRLDEISSNYDLTIDTQSNIPYDTDISYIHFPAVIDYTLWMSRNSKIFKTYL